MKKGASSSSTHILKKLFGYKREELVGQMVEVLLPSDSRPASSPARRRRQQRPNESAMGQGHELPAGRKDGSQFPVEVGFNPIPTPQGMLVLASVVDISQRKRAEEEARHHREQINLLGRVSLLGEMTASLAHELNQPLSAIVSNANAGMRFIDGGRGDPATLHEIMADVVADGHRAHEIIQNVRDRGCEDAGSQRDRFAENSCPAPPSRTTRFSHRSR